MTFSHSYKLGLLAAVLILVTAGCQSASKATSRPLTELPVMVSDPNFPLVQLPADFQSRRSTRRVVLGPGDSVKLLDAAGPGCVRHFWVTAKNPERLGIEITCDHADRPQVSMSLHQFFGVLLDKPAYQVDSGPIKVLPETGFNCYFPIPFAESCEIVLRNRSRANVDIWAMANWHRYGPAAPLTPLRLHACYTQQDPGEPLGSMRLGSAGGRGFVAGLFLAIRKEDERDVIWHTGGDTWLIDGETRPHVLRGIGTEDVFGHAFGVHRNMNPWLGGAHVVGKGPTTTEVVAYRFFGIDSVSFDSSYVLRMGTRANPSESVVYDYRAVGSSPPDVMTPRQWTLSGPFELNDETFATDELPAEVLDPSVMSWRFGNRQMPRVRTSPEHTWVDFARWYRFNRKGNGGTQPHNCAAYAATTISAEHAHKTTLRLSFDDRMMIWLNGERVAALSHPDGFDTAAVPIRLRPGENTLVIRLSNQDNIAWRCWAFSCVIQGEQD